MSEFVYEDKSRGQALTKFDAGSGTGTCLFSRYEIEDKDGDYTVKGFIPDGEKVSMLIAHTWTDIPVGSGKIRSESHGAYYDFTLTDSVKGRELGEWLRHDFSDGQPKSEFSYAFRVLDGAAHYETINGKRVRVLHARPDGSPGAWVKEISYCLAGAGVGTELTAMKDAEQQHFRRMHAKVNAAVASQHAKEQAEIKAMYARFMANHGSRR